MTDSPKATTSVVEDYLAANPKSVLKPGVVFADHQNKPDVGSNIAREWYERDGVDAVIDVPNSAVALAVTELTKQLNKVHLNASAGTTRLTGDMCNADTIHWNFDNYALANVTGRAVVESRNGMLFEVGPGSNLPGLGKVETIKRENGRLVVVAKNGIITAMSEPRRPPTAPRPDGRWWRHRDTRE